MNSKVNISTIYLKNNIITICICLDYTCIFTFTHILIIVFFTTLLVDWLMSVH